MRLAGLLALPAAAFVLLIAVSPVAAGDPASGTLAVDTLWSGEVAVQGRVVVEKGATLTIAPGATVRFMPGEPDDTGLAASGILVNGAIVAEGVPGKRITFTSGAVEPRPGDWGEVKIYESTGSGFKYCDFRYGGWGLHVHDSLLRVAGCSFADNSYGGIRGTGDGLEISDCDIRGMDIGVRFWKGAVKISHSTITGNMTGIFFRQDCEGSDVKSNNIYSNSEYNVKLGDAHTGDVDFTRNWWGTTDASAIAARIYDRAREGYIGRVLTEPPLEKEVALSGPRRPDR